VDWTPEKVTRFWDFYGAHRQGDFFSERHSKTLTAEVLRVGRPRLLVDIGCGTGSLVLELSRRGIKGIGVDGSPSALREASSRSGRQRLVPDFRLGSVASVPVGDGEADFVTLIEVIEHLDDDALGAALSEARRILAAGGILMITTPNAEDLAASTVECPDCGAQFHTVQHVRRWTAASLQSLLLASGFAHVRVRAVRPVENSPLFERLARAAVYRVWPQRPRLFAIAHRA
jgi:2-polyprenyl-3-methyl-5-hydroxy-6-metoxy-1,4-benzoquinol methylase